MSDLQQRFETAAEEAQQLPRRPDNNPLLQLYAFYKQATVGDVRGSRPGLGDFAGKLKFDAWSRMKGMSKEAAMQAYIALVEKLKGTAG